VATLRSDMSAVGIGDIGDGIHGSGYALSLEAGRKIALDSIWSLTPQAQLAYCSVSFDAFTDPFGANVALKKGDSLKGRIGTALNYDMAATGSHAYGIANLTYEFLDGTSVAVSGVDLAFEPQRFGGEIGVGSSYKWAGGKYALHGEALASTSFQGGYGFKGVIGFTAGL
jgi:outer membrane autotransporter protein